MHTTTTQKTRTILTSKSHVDLSGVLLIGDLARLFRTSDDSIRRRVKSGRFPIPPIAGVDARLRWWGPTVKAWLDSHTAREESSHE